MLFRSAIAALIETEAFGTVHITNGGDCSWHAFAAEIFRQARLDPDFGTTTSAEFGAAARRPGYSVLANNVWRNAGFAPLRPWQVALADYLALKASPPDQSRG